MTNARLEELRAKFQENPRRYFAPFANELRKSGDSAQAISICRAHLATQPGHVSGHIVLGQALYEAGSAAESRDVFTAALELDPENLIALRSLGEIAQVNGEFGAARQWYQRLLDADPRNNEVAQLLRDLPSEASFAPPADVAPLRESEEPTPLSIRNEVEAAEPEAPVPTSAHTIHTGFTGSGPAYDPDYRRPDTASEAHVEPESVVEPVAARADELTPAADAPDDEPFIDLQVTAHEDHRDAPSFAEPSVAAAEGSTEPPQAMEAIDFDAFGELQPEVVEASDTFSPTTESRENEDSRFGPPIPEPAVDNDALGVMSAPTASYVPNEATPAEPPRAVFAENGFDGPADGDEVGWLTTPSAAYSDPEAAPEDWFDVPATDDAEVAAVTGTSASAPDQPVVEDPATDSWFDDVGGATAVEPSDVSSDEFWLPPELPQVTAAEDNTRSAGEPEHAPGPEPVVAESTDAHQEPEVEQAPMVMAAADESPVEMPVAYTEPSAPAEAEAEWQPAPQYDAPDVSETPVESVAAEWAQAVPVSPDSPPSVPDESMDAPVAEEAETTIFVGHADETSAVQEHAVGAQAAPEGQPESGADADGAALPVYSATSEHAAEETAASPSVPAPDPFITETLAELYLKQGFRDEALSIYRQLLDREPGSTALRDRIESLERGSEPVPAAEPDQARVASQSVRTFFSRLARRQAATLSGRSEPDVPFAAATSALANMFEASRPSPTDEHAASTLSGAFTDPAGRPSRAAERELSLDHLFREVAPRESQGGAGGLTLDEFYSAPNAGGGSTTEPDAAPDEATGSDIRQFTAWLEGLRKK